MLGRGVTVAVILTRANVMWHRCGQCFAPPATASRMWPGFAIRALS